MIRTVTITNEPLDESQLAAAHNASRAMGAVVRFSGLVRAVEEGKPIAALDYEAFDKMAYHQFNLLLDRIEQKWPVESVRIIHRVGRVPAGAASLWVEVIAPHRAEAFAACQWLIDEMKQVVPIWKKPVP